MDYSLSSRFAHNLVSGEKGDSVNYCKGLFHFSNAVTMSCHSIHKFFLIVSPYALPESLPQIPKFW